MLKGETCRAAIITRHAAPIILSQLQSHIRLEIERLLLSEDIRATTESQCLDRVSIHTIFDIDGLWQALASLETAAIQDATGQQCSQGRQEREKGKEILASDASEDLSSQCSNLETGHLRGVDEPSRSPAVIVITSFANLLDGLYIQRPRPLAHDLMLMLNMSIRRLSRNSTHLPLIILLNDTKNSKKQTEQFYGDRIAPNQDGSKHTVEHTSDVPLFRLPSKTTSTGTKFGSIFTNLLDMHILCQPDTAISQPTTITAGMVRYSSVCDNLDPSNRMVRVCIDLDTQGQWTGALGPTMQREGIIVLLD